MNGLIPSGLGLTLNGGTGGNDRVIVNAPTEALNGADTQAGWDAADVLFGGVGSVVLANPNAFDTINATQARVDINTRGWDNWCGSTSRPATFADAAAQDIIINTGHETDPNPALLADDVTVQFSLAFRFQINGGLPQPPFGAPTLAARRPAERRGRWSAATSTSLRRRPRQQYAGRPPT